MIRRPPRSTLSSSSAASDVYKRQIHSRKSMDDILQVLPSYKIQSSLLHWFNGNKKHLKQAMDMNIFVSYGPVLLYLSLIHIFEPTRLGMISYAVFCLKKKK